MTTAITEANGLAPADSPNPKPTKKACVAPRRAHVASSKAKSSKKASLAKKAAPAPKKPAAKTERGREGSKTSQVLALLYQPEGVTLKELMKVTGWQAHSVRGLLSGTIRKKMRLAITSTKGENGERTYSINT